ncbi:MAG TPA: chemotaxis protein CheB [Usitatibacter sp.]|nr:chemotaxis protein CheB [Usitatibacter sp.]
MQYDLITIVASPRGLPALRHLLSELPSSFATPIVCLVQSHAALAEELQARSRLRVRWAQAGVPVEKGTVYLSHPGTSLVARPDGTFTVTPFGPESSSLDPVDSFLVSIANVRHDRVLALVLAGFDRDGVIGCDHVKRMGGTVLVLDRATARYWGMADPIVQAGAADRVLTIVEVAEALRGCFTSQDLLRCAEIQIRLGDLLETALRVSGTFMGHITRRTRDTDELRIVVQRGLDVEFFEHFEAMPAGDDTAWCRAVRLRSPILIADVSREPSHPAHRLAQVPYRAEYAVPLLAGQAEEAEARGALTALFPQARGCNRFQSWGLDRVAREAAGLITRIA